MNRISALINGNPVEIAFDSLSVHVYNAFPVKDDLKSRGYRWNPGDKSWFLQTESVEEEVELLKNGLKPSVQKSPVPKSPGELEKFPESLTVTDLRNRIDQLLRNSIKGRVWIRGVIASEVKNYQWASYFDIRDEDENLNIYFRAEVGKREINSIVNKLKVSGVSDGLEKDLPVFALFEVKIPLKNVVDIRLKMVDILPEYTQSRIKNQREITVDRLTKEGKIDNQKSLVLPKMTYRVGLITSAQGTSIEDIMAGLHPCEKRYDFIFGDARMEGSTAADSVISAFNRLENHPSFRPDLIILARGGGSEQSLAVFNDYRICRRITEASVPVIAAIGHEKDLSAAELCAHLYPIPSTPSGVGKFLKERFEYLQQELSEKIGELSKRFTDLCYREEERVRRLGASSFMFGQRGVLGAEEKLLGNLKNLKDLESMKVREEEKRVNETFKSLTGRFRSVLLRGNNELRSRIDRMFSETSNLLGKRYREAREKATSLDFRKRYLVADKLRNEIRNRAQNLFLRGYKSIEDRDKEIVMKQNLIKANDPARILNKGFTLIYDEKSKVVTSLEDFKDKESFLIAFKDGKTDNLKR